MFTTNGLGPAGAVTTASDELLDDVRRSAIPARVGALYNLA
ncbi:MAG TPA: hypothetical protein VGK19_01560 [Capsulimonadaceae bacterium]